jgi:carbonic anhydrase
MVCKFVPATALLLSLALPAAGLAKPKYGYTGEVAPEKWGQLSPEYAACSTGSSQAPLNIVTAKTVKDVNSLPLKPAYVPGPAEVKNTGTGIKVFLKGDLKIGAADYKLLEFHFHAPGEEAINGVHYPLNAHLVHTNADGVLKVIGINLKVGAPNAYLQSFWSKLPAKKDESVKVDLPSLAGLLSKSLAYFTYSGSLTTPPCTEGVQFFILKEPVTISAKQLETFVKLYPLNARPVQPLNGRVIKSSN